MKKDLVIVGGGPAGLAVAVKAYDLGVRDILILEREEKAGGVLKQCIHSGFGLTRFGENMTGPEYANKFYEEVKKRNIEIKFGVFVTDIDGKKRITCVSDNGVITIKAKAIALCMGCRERSKGALNIAGNRPAGIFSAGTAQKYVNVYGRLPGKRVVVLGSGDIGLIMARRLTLEGAEVLCVSEIMEHSSGLKRNIAQCLDDFNIPLYLSHTIVEIKGKDRVEEVVIAKVDQNKKPIAGTEKSFKCDTVLFSVGLIPENELTLKAGISLDKKTKGAIVDEKRQTEIDGVFASGNVLHVHDLVDFVSEEAEIAGKGISEYLLSKNKNKQKKYVNTICGNNVGYVVPQKINLEVSEPVKLFFRVREPMKNAVINVTTASGVKKINKIAVAPGEMEYVTLKPEEIKGAKEIVINVTLKGENNG